MRNGTKRWAVFCALAIGLIWAGLDAVEAKKSPTSIQIEALPLHTLASPEILRKGVQLHAKTGSWTWFGIPGTKCGYGTKTGMAINPSPQKDAKTLIIMLQGGGACWKEKGLMGGCFSLPRSAFGLKGIGAREFKTDWRLRRVRSAFLLQRKHPANPLKQAHYAILPYCTGDLHAGNTKVTFSKDRTIYFHGHANMLAYLKRLVPTFPNVKRVILAGVSAGGVGASLHWQRVQRAFGPKVRVDLLNDAGAPLNPLKSRWDTWQKRWQLQLPKGCSDCGNGITEILKYYQNTMLKKGGRMAFLGHTNDRVIRTFLGLGFFGKIYHRHLQTAMKRFDKIDGAHYFILKGGNHVMLFRRNAYRLKGDAGKGPTLAKWITQFIKHDPTWASTGP